MKSATIVIPNWNGMQFLKTCMDSLRIQDTDDFETLVIDNASEDGSAEFLRENYPEARVEVMRENLGFAGGVNEGILRCGSEFVILLNNDVECDRSFVSSLLRAIKSDEKIFSVSSKMIRFRERELLDDAGDLYTVLGYQAQRGTGQRADDPKYNRRCSVFSACAGAAIYRKRVFDEIGLFDTSHFAYLEDIDVGYRALIYGYKNIYEPSAVVYHIGSASSGGVKYNDFKVKLSARNNQYLLYKNMPGFFRALNALPLAAGRAYKRRFFKKRGFSAAYEEGLRLGRENRKKLRKVAFRASHFRNYIKIEAMEIRFAFVYISEYLSRRKAKRRDG